MDIARWLTEHGLDKYAAAFRDAEIDMAALRHLTDDDLKDMGLPIGPRRKALAAIAVLTQTAAAERAIAVAAASEAPRAEAERRQLTVLFADLVGSTAMSQGMDPEEMRLVIRGFQDAAAGAIARYEGHVAKFMGDGVLAYFGWPRAHEDDAERAVRTGLALMEAIAGGVRRQAVRIGIATGETVVGDVVGQGGAREEAAVGDTLNLAARLQQLAEPDTVVVAAATRALLGETFEFATLGPQSLKGIATPVEAWRVLGERSVETRFEAARGRRLGPLVGRDQELAMVLARWDLARAGEGQVVLLRAEPGIGKSRLAAELRARIEPQTVAVVSFQGSPHHANSAFYPVIQQLTRAARLEPDDAVETKLVKLGDLVARSRIDGSRAVPLLASLLSIPSNDVGIVAALSPPQQREETQAVLLDLLAGLAAEGPVLVLIEDLHWFDPTTHALLDEVVARIESLPVLALATFRPEIATPWEGRGHATVISLNRLGRRQVEVQITAIAAARTLPAEVIEQIVAKSDGVPLFVEELTKLAIESGDTDTPRTALAVPTSLRASLLARLDRLPDAREIAPIAAALGREFDFDLLAAVTPRGAEQATAALADLQRAELIFPRGTPPRTRWSFKHALIQDAAYDTLLKTARTELHARIARTIVSRFPALADAEPETVAHHYELGGEVRQALEQWTKAGTAALGRHAGAEAVQHFERALALSAQALTPRDAVSLLDLEISLGEALMIAGRLVDVKAIMPRLIAAARETGRATSLARAAYILGYAELNTFSTQRTTVEAFNEALARMPEGEEALRLRTMNGLSRALTMIGEFASASAIADEAVALARELRDHAGLTEALELRFFIPVGLSPRQIAEYRRAGRELVEATRKGSYPLSRVRVLTQQFYWSAQFGDIAALRERLAEYIDLCAQLRVDYLSGGGDEMRAMHAILQGDFTAAETAAHKGLELTQREHQSNAHGIYGIQMFTIRREQGRLAEIAGLFKRFVDEAPEGSTWEPGFALLASDLGFEAPARRILAKHAATGFALPADAIRSATLAFFAEAATRLRDRDSAERIFALLLPYEHMTVTIGMTVVCYGAASRFIGLLADLLEDRAIAEAQFERALEINARMEAWPWLAHTQADYAAALRRWGRASDLARAGELAGAAMETAQRLGMAFLQRRLAAQLQ